MATDYTVYDKKMLGGQGGEGILIEQVAFKVDQDQKTNEDTVYVELMGTAYTVLKDGYNPSAGYDDLPEPIPVADRLKIVVAEGKKSDNEILINNINRAFGLEEPLVDNDTLWERFTEEGKDSVVKEIVGKPAYFKMAKNASKTGELLGHYFFNLSAVAKRIEPKMDLLKDKMAAIMAKRAAKQKAKEKAEAELTGAGVGNSTEDIPF